MTLANSDLVQETTSTTGTGTLTLSGAVAGYQSFAIVGTGNTTYYCIRSGTNKEVGIGSYTASGTTLSRDTVLYSSAGGTTKITVSAGATVINTYPAETSVSGGGGGTYPTIQPSLNLDFANTKLLDPRITFVRNSTAAYYDEQTTALAEQNLLTYSQDFSNVVWVKSATTVTANTDVAPDGTLTASTITTTSNSIPSIRSNGTVLQNTAITISIFLKATSQRYILVASADGLNSFFVIVDTLNWVITDARSEGTGTYTSSSLVQYPNGFYRVIATGITRANSSVATPQARPCDTATSTTHNVNVTNSPTTYIVWGAQLEQRSSATAYTPTTTAAITNYIPVLMTASAGVARFDCDPITGESLGLLIEESRTNLLTYSSDFSNAVWVKNNSTVTSAANVAPDGTQTGSKIVESTILGSNFIAESVTVTNGSIYTGSIYVKAGERKWAMVLLQAGAGNFQGYYINLLTGALGIQYSTGASASVVSIGNGWYRVGITATTTGTSCELRCYSATSNGGGYYTGDGYSGLFTWGAQLEAGSFATSLIPTLASTVTRAADQASMTGTNFSSWYNQAQGSLYTESDDNGINNNGAATLFNTGAAGNNAIAFYGNGTLNTARLLVRLNTVYVINTSSSATTQPIKQAASFKDGAVSCTANGILFVTNVNVNIPHNLDTLYIGYFPGTVSYLTGHIRKLSYYPVALSSSNLVALTS